MTASVARRVPSRGKLVKLVAAVVVGLGVGTMLPPEPVAVPGVGSVPGLLVGGVAVVAGVLLYTRAPSSASADCGCDGACDC